MKTDRNKLLKGLWIARYIPDSSDFRMRYEDLLKERLKARRWSGVEREREVADELQRVSARILLEYAKQRLLTTEIEHCSRFHSFSARFPR